MRHLLLEAARKMEIAADPAPANPSTLQIAAQLASRLAGEARMAGGLIRAMQGAGRYTPDDALAARLTHLAKRAQAREMRRNDLAHALFMQAYSPRTHHSPQYRRARKALARVAGLVKRAELAELAEQAAQ